MSSAIWLAERSVRSERLVSLASRCLVRWQAFSVGTLVNRLTTSKLTMMSEESRVRLLVISTNWLELAMWWGMLPTKGCRLLVR